MYIISSGPEKWEYDWSVDIFWSVAADLTKLVIEQLVQLAYNKLSQSKENCSNCSRLKQRCLYNTSANDHIFWHCGLNSRTTCTSLTPLTAKPPKVITKYQQLLKRQKITIMGWAILEKIVQKVWFEWAQSIKHVKSPIEI